MSKPVTSPPEKKRGRPKGAKSKRLSPLCKLTPEIVRQFAEIVRKGNFRMTACQRLGISRNLYSAWMEQGRTQIREVERGERKEIRVQGCFVLALDEAEANVHAKIIEDVLLSDNLTVRQWYLERRFRKIYRIGSSVAATLDDETGEEVKIEAGTILLERLLAALGTGGEGPGGEET